MRRRTRTVWYSLTPPTSTSVFAYILSCKEKANLKVNCPRLNSNAMRYNTDSTLENSTLTVQAGEKLALCVYYKGAEKDGGPFLYHNGPLSAYMGHVSEGRTGREGEEEGMTVG